jgi:TonB-dependent SusC/RagA subfamily outer membrane receptor
MKKLLLISYLMLFMIQMIAQEIPTIKVGKDKLGITSLDIKVEVVGNIAMTTYDMLFYNPTNEILEGELAFPLGEGQKVSRLALEVNGKLREAVVVEREQGRITFEAVVRRRVDPVLLEKGTGNNYKARIYPIPRNGYKRIVLAYEQELNYSDGAHYFNLPLDFKKSLDEFSFEMDVYDQKLKPELTFGELENFKFVEAYNSYSAKISNTNFIPDTSLIIKIPEEYNTNKIITFDDYFYVYQTFKPEIRTRAKATSITLLWDASYSMKGRDYSKEIDFLNAYFTYLKNVKIELIVFSNDVRERKIFSIKNGDWQDLKSELSNVVYDGGTSYTKLLDENLSDEILLFSDGMKNLSDIIINTDQSVFVVNSIIKANHSELNKISESTNGIYINLKNNSVDEAFKKITLQPYKFLGIKSANKSIEFYPNTPVNVSSDFSVAGKNFKNGDQISLLFGFGNTVTDEQVFKLDSNVNNNLVKRLWAQKKLDVLQRNSKTNKANIIKHSKKYNLVSNHTSLIVLETAWDYYRFKILPPEDLIEAYNELMKRYNGKRVVASNGENNNAQDDNVTQISRNNIPTSNGNISGIISDASGMPLPGVNVIVRGTGEGTQTDFDGRYSINARTGDILTFSYVGLITLETTVGGTNNINISMREDSAVLDEVVVTAQGIKRDKKALGYAVSEINSKEIENRTEGDVARVLSGKASGLQITSQSGSSGSATNIVIRGYSSINGNNQALIIVDGVPFSNDNNTTGSFASGNVGSSRMIDLDPNSIESIQVIKGLAAATLYGTEGRNGVILITTKAGSSTLTRPTVGYSNSTSNRKVPIRKQIKLDNLIVDTPYLRALNIATSVEEAYQIYLIQRELYKESPSFYIDVYDYFKKWKEPKIGLRILTNIAEIDNDNYELLRAFAYKLEEANNNLLAAFIYSRVLELRPEDSQSYRDLALVYKEIGLAQKAFELLNSVVSEKIYQKEGRRKFKGVQSIAKHELNERLSNKKNNEKEEFDIRIVIDWNHNDTDIDLHVIDPNYEDCYYGNTKTKIGGRISSDMTQGFGPEEFTLKNAVKGDYYLKVKYFGDRYQKVENPTFMKITIFKNYGKLNQTKKIKVVRLTNKQDNIVVSKVSI